jgi:hypothetical protein
MKSTDSRKNTDTHVSFRTKSTKAQTAMTPAEISTQVQPFLSYPRNKMDELGWFSERKEKTRTAMTPAAKTRTAMTPADEKHRQP